MMRAFHDLRFMGMALLALGGPVWAADSPPPRPVVSEIVSPDAGQNRQFAGEVVAEVTSVLAFQTSGRVARLEVAAGDVVQAGAVLATLDQITLDQDADAARAAVRSARASAYVAQQGLDRARSLVQRGVASDQSLESAQQLADTTAAQLTAAEAALTRAEDAARFGSLTAPMDGVVLSTAVKPGTVVAAGTTVLTMAATDRREAVVAVPADFLALLGPETAFRIHARVPDAPDVMGHVRLIEPVADPQVKSRRIHLTLDSAPPLYRIGSLIAAELAQGPTPQITLPQAAILQGAAGQPALVWRIDPATRAARPTPVILGRTLGDRVIIKDGLTAGDEVAIRGIHSLTDGQILGERVP